MSAFLALLSAAQLCFSPWVRETSFWKGQGRDSKAVSRTLSCQPTAHRASKACGETQRPRSGKGCLHTWVGGVERQGVEAQKPDSPQDRNEEERATVQVPEQLPGAPPDGRGSPPGIPPQPEPAVHYPDPSRRSSPPLPPRSDEIRHPHLCVTCCVRGSTRCSNTFDPCSKLSLTFFRFIALECQASLESLYLYSIQMRISSL